MVHTALSGIMLVEALVVDRELCGKQRQSRLAG